MSPSHIPGIDILGRPAARIAGEELECAGADGQSCLAHGQKAFG